jgi:transposase
VTKKLVLLTIGLLFAIVVGFELGAANAYAAAKKVDCTKVMSELNSGKKVKEVAKDEGISTTSVYRCRRAAKKESTAAKKTAAAAPSSKAAEPATPKK